MVHVQGYEWEEDKWHVDLSGHTGGAVDAEGWAYAVDFAWLPMPPPPGSGRKCAPTASMTTEATRRLHQSTGSAAFAFQHRKAQ